MQKQQEQQQQQQLQAFTQQQTQLLAEKLPDIADPQKGRSDKKGLDGSRRALWVYITGIGKRARSQVHTSNV